MKTLIAAALLLALTFSALAYGDHVSLACGPDIDASLWKNTVTVELPQDRPFTLRRSSSGNILVNGKKCVFLTDEMYHRRDCMRGNETSCEAVEAMWPGGKLPKFFADKLRWKKACKDNDEDACNALKAGWPREPLPNSGK